MAEKQRLVALNVKRFHEHIYRVLNQDERRTFVEVFNRFQKRRNVALLVTDLRTLLDNPEKEEIVLHLLNVLRPSEKEQFFQLWMKTSAFEALYKANIANNEVVLHEGHSPSRNAPYNYEPDSYFLDLSLEDRVSYNDSLEENRSDVNNSPYIMGKGRSRNTYNVTNPNATTNGDRYTSPRDGNIRIVSSNRRNRSFDTSPQRSPIRKDRPSNRIQSKPIRPTSGLKLPSKTVLLKRAKEIGFGFSIRGGVEHGIGIFISAIISSSPASQAGLRKGDQLLKVNGIGFQKISHSAAVQVIKDSRKLKMTVYSLGLIPGSRVAQMEYKWVNPNGLPVSPLAIARSEVTNQKSDMRLLKHDDERKVNVFSEINSKLGIFIRGGNEFGLGIFIAGVDKSSIAEKAGIKVGDQILNVNGIDFSNISHQDAVKALKRSKMMTLVLCDVGKIPLARVLYDKTEWLDEQNDRKAKESVQQRKGVHSQEEVMNSMFRQGIAGSQLLHHSTVGVSAEALIEENARYVLDENQLGTLKYYLQEYSQKTVSINGLVLALTELLDTPEKMGLFSEIRNIVQPQDIHSFDELVLRKEINAMRSSSPYKEVSSSNRRSVTPFVPEFLAPDSSSSQDGTESDSNTHAHISGNDSGIEVARSLSYMSRNFVHGSELLPTSAIAEEDHHTDEGDTSSNISRESDDALYRSNLAALRANGSRGSEGSLNWYELEKEKQEIRNVKRMKPGNARGSLWEGVYDSPGEVDNDRPPSSPNRRTSDPDSTPNVDDTFHVLVTTNDHVYSTVQRTDRSKGRESPNVPRVITRAEVRPEMENGNGFGRSSLSSSSENLTRNDHHWSNSPTTEDAPVNDLPSVMTVTSSRFSSLNIDTGSPVVSSRGDIVVASASDISASYSPRPANIFQFNITSRDDTPELRSGYGGISPSSPSNPRPASGGYVRNAVETFSSAGISSPGPIRSPGFIMREFPLIEDEAEDSERTPVTSAGRPIEPSDRSTTSSPDIIVPSDAWKHHRKIFGSRSHSVAGDHPQVTIEKPQRKGTSVTHNAYATTLSPKWNVEMDRRSNGSDVEHPHWSASHSPLGTRSDHYQSANDLGYHNDAYSASVATRVQLLQEKDPDLSIQAGRNPRLTPRNRTQSVDELALRQRVDLSPNLGDKRTRKSSFNNSPLVRTKSLSHDTLNSSYDFRAHELSPEPEEDFSTRDQIYSAVSLDSLLNADYDAPIDKSLGASSSHIQNINFMRSMPSPMVDRPDKKLSVSSLPASIPESPLPEVTPTIGSVLSLAKIFESHSSVNNSNDKDKQRASRFSFTSEDAIAVIAEDNISNETVTSPNEEYPPQPVDFSQTVSHETRVISIDKTYDKHGLTIRESKDLTGVEIASIEVTKQRWLIAKQQ